MTDLLSYHVLALTGSESGRGPSQFSPDHDYEGPYFQDETAGANGPPTASAFDRRQRTWSKSNMNDPRNKGQAMTPEDSALSGDERGGGASTGARSVRSARSARSALSPKSWADAEDPAALGLGRDQDAGSAGPLGTGLGAQLRRVTSRTSGSDHAPFSSSSNGREGRAERPRHDRKSSLGKAQQSLSSLAQRISRTPKASVSEDSDGDGRIAYSRAGAYESESDGALDQEDPFPVRAKRQAQGRAAASRAASRPTRAGAGADAGPLYPSFPASSDRGWREPEEEREEEPSGPGGYASRSRGRGPQMPSPAPPAHPQAELFSREVRARPVDRSAVRTHPPRTYEDPALGRGGRFAPPPVAAGRRSGDMSSRRSERSGRSGLSGLSSVNRTSAGAPAATKTSLRRVSTAATSSLGPAGELEENPEYAVSTTAARSISGRSGRSGRSARSARSGRSEWSNRSGERRRSVVDTLASGTGATTAVSDYSGDKRTWTYDPPPGPTLGHSGHGGGGRRNTYYPETSQHMRDDPAYAAAAPVESAPKRGLARLVRKTSRRVAAA